MKLGLLVGFGANQGFSLRSKKNITTNHTNTHEFGFTQCVNRHEQKRILFVKIRVIRGKKIVALVYKKRPRTQRGL